MEETDSQFAKMLDPLIGTTPTLDINHVHELRMQILTKSTRA